MKEIKNIPIFRYGLSPNGTYISKDVVEKAASSFKEVPVIDYTSSKNEEVIGFVKSITNIKDDVVYGDVMLFGSQNFNDFCDYEINIENYHQENSTIVIDDFKLLGVGLEIKNESVE